MDHIDGLRRNTRDLRRKLIAHPVYQMVNSLGNLRIFMERHVFAVWDFMSLLKRLQQLQTGIEVPWLPRPERTVARFVNEMVLAEESDEDGRGGFVSHFDLYREAMRECGASTSGIDCMTEAIAAGLAIGEALRKCAAEAAVRQFVQTTWSFIASSKPHCIAAAYTFGREDVIPDMFRQCVASLATEPGCPLRALNYYLARHIELDELDHAPMAIAVMRELCGEDTGRWIEAGEAVRTALESRIALWDGIVSACRVPAPTLSVVAGE